MEAVALVVVLGALFTRAKCAEVLSCLRHLLTEDFKDDARLLVALLALGADGDVEVGLNIVLVELGETLVGLLNLDGILIVVDTLAEESSEASLSFLGLIGFLLLDGLELGAEVSIRGCQLDSSFDVGHCFVEFVQLKVSNRAQVESLSGGRVDLVCLGAVENSGFKVMGVVRAHGHVLQNRHHQTIQLLSRVFDSLGVGEGIAVLTLSDFEGALFELDVTLVFQVHGGRDEFGVAHHPSGGSSVGDLNKLNLEDKGGVTWDFGRRSHGSVGVIGFNGEFSSLAELHAHDSDVPTVDNLANTNGHFQGFLILGAIENSTVCESTSVVNKDFLTFLDRRAILSHLKDLLNNSSIVVEVNHVSNLLRWCFYHFVRVKSLFVSRN